MVFKFIAIVGLSGESSLNGAKQADMTGLKLIMADGREVELGLVFLRSFPPLRLLGADLMVLPLLRVDPPQHFRTSRL